MTQFIAERKLLYSIKGGDVRKEFLIRLSIPYDVREGAVDFPVGAEGLSGCHVEIVGLNETYPEVYGADSLQATTLATQAVESLLRRFQKKYNIYYLNGDPYFDAPDLSGTHT